MTIQKTPQNVDQIKASLASALELAGQGISVFPVKDDKKPACPHGFKDATTDCNAVRLLWKSYPAPLVGVVTGVASGFDALDIDPRHGGDTWLAEHAEKIQATRIHRTRSGGWHYLFQPHAGLRNSAGRIAAGVDVRAAGGYLIWWPAAGLSILNDVFASQWPDWLLSLALPPLPPLRPAFSPLEIRHCDSLDCAYAQASLSSAANSVAHAPEGQRNDTLNREMFSLLRFATNGALDEEEIAITLANAALSAGLGRREIEATLASALRARRA